MRLPGTFTFRRVLFRVMTMRLIFSMLAVLLLLPAIVGCGGGTDLAPKSEAGSGGRDMEKAIFAGGCFWCMEPPFEKLDGVFEVVSGYTGGEGANPTYGDYSKKGHIEAIEITYDPALVTYGELLDLFWRSIDPTDSAGQFVDRGPHYRSAVFYRNDEEKRLAEESKSALDATGRFDSPIVTEILKAAVFYPAEDYHQDFYRSNSSKYKRYRSGSGRDRYFEKVWGDEKS